VEILLGQGDDHFTVSGTVEDSITVVHGGGGHDTLLVTGGGGPTAPLVLFGDTSQDGSAYTTTTTLRNGTGRVFTNHGNDTIDARGATGGVTIYGGRGNDTIYGSAYGDHLAGGSGNDTIHGIGGANHIYGDSGFNLDLSKRLSLLVQDGAQILLVIYQPVPSGLPVTGDGLLTPGDDMIFGGIGADLIIGDYGTITQVPGTVRLLTTGNLVEARTVRPDEGGDDLIFGGPGNDVILGGAGSDTIFTGVDSSFAFDPRYAPEGGWARASAARPTSVAVRTTRST
jgi:Ca2+-binding RTX toxin-like protein